MIDPGESLRWATLLLLIGWRFYWHVTELQAVKEKPIRKKTYPLLHKNQMSKYVTLLIFGIIGVQLLGIPLFTMQHSSAAAQFGGFLLVVAGIVVACTGRHALGTNWARCYDYQVKQNQQLVTHGIYRFMRHPLYMGITLFLIGAELVVQSYLVFPYLLVFWAVYIQAKREERLLLSHFGEQYQTYMRKTKRFIPFIW